jgi:hypothetical protein
MKEEIGFKHGIPEDPSRLWERNIKGRTFQFSKKRKSKSFFTYNCKCHNESDRFIGSSQTGFVSDRDLAPAEIETLPQFTQFIDRCTRA